MYRTLPLVLCLMTANLFADSYQGKAEIPDLTITTASGFHVIELEGGAYLPAAGAPSIPFLQINVAVPPLVSVDGVRVKGTEIVELDGKYDVMPMAQARCISDPPEGNPLVKGEVYGMNESYPGHFAETAGTWDLAGQEFVVVHLYPVQYNPVTKKISFARTIDFEVLYTPDTGAVRETYNFSESVRRHYRGRLEEAAFNPEDLSGIPAYVPSARSNLDPGDYEYVIITHLYFGTYFKDLVDWRTKMGMPAKIVDYNWIFMTYPGASIPDKIRAFVKDANATWGTLYFMLGGDTGYVAYHVWEPSGDAIPNDTFYADFDDDWKYEVYVGRAPINDQNQITRFVDKVLTYEKTPPANYGSNVFFMGFDLDSSTPSENCKKEIKDKWIPPSTLFAQEYDSEPGGHTGDVIAYMNYGYNLINHIDHCGTAYIGIGYTNHGTGFDGTQATNFTNGNRYGNFYTLGCWPGNYPDTCWGELYVRDDQGGVTFTGNSRSGWYNPGNTQTLSHMYERKWWEALYYNNAYRAGETLARSLNKFYPINYTYKYVYQELNLIGDPGLHLWTAEPSNLAVTHPGAIYTGSQSMSVNITSGGANVFGALVCLMKDGEVYERGLTGPTGTVFLNIDPITAGTMSVTATAQDCKCYEGTVDVASPIVPPVVQSIEPKCGMETGGTAVIVKGANFTVSPPMSVKIGGDWCTSLSWVDESTITCTAPAGINGFKDVVVTNIYGSDTLNGGYRYFPVNGYPFNGADVSTESLNTPAETTLIVSGKPLHMVLAFLSFGGGPLPSAFGNAGLDYPFIYLFTASLNASGYLLVPFDAPAGYGPLDVYVHTLGYDGSGNIVWANGGNNPNGTGSVWYHLNN